MTATLRQRDRDTVSDFACRSWLGFAEEHWVELDFGDRLAKFKPDDQLILCLAGWTDYPYPESIWAATQAGIPLLPPTLERLDDNCHWQTVIADAGFPAGLPRMMTLDVTGSPDRAAWFASAPTWKSTGTRSLWRRSCKGKQ